MTVIATVSLIALFGGRESSLASPPSGPQEHLSIFELLSGAWVGPSPGSCGDNPHTISFDDDRSSMVLSYRRPIDGPLDSARVFRYRILAVADTALRVEIVEPPETRRNAFGELVVWDLVVVNPQVYRWRATDWSDGVFTKDVKRCS